MHKPCKPPLAMASLLRNGCVARKPPAWLATLPNEDLATSTSETAQTAGLTSDFAVCRRNRLQATGVQVQGAAFDSLGLGN